MSKLRTFLATGLVVCLAPLAAPAQETAGSLPQDSDLRVLIETIRANRRALVAVNLGLGSEEAAKFWPLYEEYQKAVNVSADRIAAIVEEYIGSFTTLSDERALELMRGYLAAEGERVELKQKFLPRFAAILPGRTVARFYQIENKMDAVIRFDAASVIPVIDEKAEAPAP